MQIAILKMKAPHEEQKPPPAPAASSWASIVVQPGTWYALVTVVLWLVLIVLDYMKKQPFQWVTLPIVMLFICLCCLPAIPARYWRWIFTRKPVHKPQIVATSFFNLSEHCPSDPHKGR